MNTLNSISPDTIWIYGAITVSFLAGCVYRLCSALSYSVTDSSNPGLEALTQRYDRDMVHVRELHDELIHVKLAFESRAEDSEHIPKPAELGIDPFKLARSGASIKVLMQRCRLSRAEAELVYSVHGAGSGRKVPSKEQQVGIGSSRHVFTA